MKKSAFIPIMCILQVLFNCNGFNKEVRFYSFLFEIYLYDPDVISNNSGRKNWNEKFMTFKFPCLVIGFSLNTADWFLSILHLDFMFYRKKITTVNNYYCIDFILSLLKIFSITLRILKYIVLGFFCLLCSKNE